MGETVRTAARDLTDRRALHLFLASRGEIAANLKLKDPYFDSAYSQF